MPFTSIIITTYNWPEALEASLTSLLDQNHKNFEIIIADDGSTAPTKTLIKKFQATSTISIKHVFHEDQGFRAGTIRNKAVAASEGDYLIFVDGDCITLPSFIHRHQQLAEPNFFVPGNRVLLSKEYSPQVLSTKDPLHKKSLPFFLYLWATQKLNRYIPFLHLPLGPLRCLTPKKWQKAMTCNLAIWKKDFIAVNGFDEQFQGWGYEDSDLVIRLIHNRIKRKEGRFAVPVLHLWHKENDRSQHDENYQRLLDRLSQPNFIQAQSGFSQYN